MQKKKSKTTSEQEKRRFLDAAAELGCDMTDEEFVGKLKAISTVPPMSNADLKKGKKLQN